MAYHSTICYFLAVNTEDANIIQYILRAVLPHAKSWIDILGPLK